MPDEKSPQSPLLAHSYMEIHLFLQLAMCEQCHVGQLKPLSPNLLPPTTPDSTIIVATTCSQCQQSRELSFGIPKNALPSKPEDLTHINQTSEPSRLIDLAQWLTLDQMLCDAFLSESDAKLARRTGIKASLCLGEALKFFDDPNNDLPPTEAFFLESSHARFKKNPQLYSRQRILALRAKRPMATASELSAKDAES